jgi:hypothetical protein
MTIPRGFTPGRRRLTDVVREMIPHLRNALTPDERALAIHLRGNEALYLALTTLVRSRIEGRAKLPEPTDPLAAKSMVARDRELQWVLARLEFVYRSPVSQPAEDDSEPPAA